MPSLKFRQGLIVFTSIILILSALWLHLVLGMEPQVFSLHMLDPVIFALDLVILGYITFVAWERRNRLLLLVAVLQLALLIYLELVLRPDTSQFATMIIDRLAVVMYLVISVVGSFICLYALQYMEVHDEHAEKKGRNGRFFLWFVSFLGIMNGLVFANNLLWLYLFWEGTTLCSFQLIGHDDTEEARNNAMRALLYNSLGGLALILAVSILVREFGSGAATLATVVESGWGITSTAFLGAVALLTLAGFTKAAQFPFQSWLLGAMVAPTPVSALLHSSTMVKAGVYLILRLAPAFSGVLLSSAIALAGVFTFFAGSLLAVVDENAKRVLAYSTVANLGLIIACCGLNTPLAINAATMLIIFHAVSKALLFMGVGVIEQRLGSRNIENMEGLAGSMPAMAFVMTIGVFSMFLPPFGMLFAKWMAMEASLREPLLLILFVAGSTLTAFFWTKWLGRMLTTAPGSDPPMRKLPMSGYYTVSLGFLSLAAVLMSFGITGVIQGLAVPATIAWYPAALRALPGMNIAAFPWTRYFNPDIIPGGSILLEGLFPTGLLFAGLVMTMVFPLLLFEPEREKVGSVYLSGENVDRDNYDQFYTAMDNPTPVALGGYYFKTFFNVERLNWRLNAIALIILLVIMGVIWV